MDVLIQLLKQDTLSCFAYLMLILAIVSHWVVRSWWLRGGICALAVALSIYMDRIMFLGVFWLVALAIATLWIDTYRRCRREIFAFPLVLFSYLIAAHHLPGFNNWKVLDDVVLSSGAVPYSLYLNFDKALVAWILVAFWVKPRPVVGFDWPVIWTCARLSLFMLGGLAALSTFSAYVTWDPKIPRILLLWALCNLFITCIAEEALFRGVIQHALERLVNTSWIAVPLTSVLFGLAHYQGGMTYVVLASLAGGVYGVVYYRTRSLLASIFLHFTLNLTHLLLFTYPALK